MYLIQSEKYNEDPNQKLGSGSEGAVYPFPDDPTLCVKLFHDPEPGDKTAKDIAVYRAKKITAICAMHLRFSPQFALPLQPAFGQSREVKGFLMPRVKPGFVKILELLKPWRRSNNIGLKDISLLFARLIGTDLACIEAQGLSVGDINTGCVMINAALERCWVDTDSWSYPNFPCLATTELYAHPELYPNLEKSKKFVPPKIYHDRFAMTVMFVQIALQGGHPFRMGLHPKYSSLRDRAGNGITVFDSGVTYPKALPPPELLSDELIDRILRILKQKKDDPDFGKALTEFADMITTCGQCGTDYAATRAHCPKCHQKTIVSMAKLVKLLIEVLYKASGTMLHIQVVEKQVRIVCQVNDSIHLITIDEKGTLTTVPTTLAATKGAKYRFFGKCMAIVRDRYAPAPVAVEIYSIDGAHVKQLKNASTGGLENGQALLDSSERFLYRTAGNTLMCGRLFGNSTLLEERVCQVHQSQTWFIVDHYTGAPREAAFGYDRALRDIQWFVIRGDKEGNKFSYHEVQLPQMRQGEKQTDFAVYFSNETVLLVRKTLYRGQEFVRYSVISLLGKVERDELVDEKHEGYFCWEQLEGKMFQGDSVLHVTAKGVVKQTFADGKYNHLEETEGVIMITDQLFRCNNKVGVARRDAILTISKKQAV